MSKITPTQIAIELPEFLYQVTFGLEMETEDSYTFDLDIYGVNIKAVGARIVHYDAATGLARLKPEMIYV